MHLIQNPRFLYKFSLQIRTTDERKKKTEKDNCAQRHGGHVCKKRSDLASVIGDGKYREGIVQKHSHKVIYYDNLIRFMTSD